MIEDLLDAISFSLSCDFVNFKRKWKPEEIVKHGKVFYQDKRTVLRIGDDVFMSVPEKGEKYDKEKGLLICIMKAMGLSTSDFLKIKENSKDVKKKGVSHKTR